MTKTLGLLGGMSWESTLVYYRELNRMVAQQRGGLHSAPLLVHSFDFAELEPLLQRGEWDRLSARLAGAAQSLECAGAQALLICSNTMHRCAEQVQGALNNMQVLHIADAVAEALNDCDAQRILLTGTAYTMEQPFYREWLQSRLAGGDKQVLIPAADNRKDIHRMIFDELCQGVFSDATSERFRQIIAAERREQGADAVLLACTELGLILSPGELDIPVLDTTLLHCAQACDFALGRAHGQR